MQKNKTPLLHLGTQYVYIAEACLRSCSGSKKTVAYGNTLFSTVCVFVCTLDGSSERRGRDQPLDARTSLYHRFQFYAADQRGHGNGTGNSEETKSPDQPQHRYLLTCVHGRHIFYL